MALQNLPSSSKTLYTPVFYATPTSSLQGPEKLIKPIPKAYLERLSKQHIALATKFQEVPSSRSTSPDSNGISAARVEALRKRVKEAFKYANGNPADGKWAVLAGLLKLNATRRTRWLNTTTEGKMAESSFGWINAATEEEWEEWEAMWLKEEQVKQKVENWKRDVDVVTVESVPQDKPIKHVPTIQNIIATQKRASSTLGFPVVKRASITIAGKKPKAAASNAAAGSSRLSSNAPRAPKPPLDSSSQSPPRAIEDLSESSFLPPSFPSQLNTSTPKAKTVKKHKPDPILLAPPSSSPLPTPPSVRVYGRQRTMSSLSELPSTPTRPQPLREKRERSVTPPHPSKKARTSEQSPTRPQTPPLVVAPITPVVTPHRPQLPKLLDLIASSAKKSKVASNKKRSTVTRTSSEATPASASASIPSAAEPAPAPEPIPISEPQLPLESAAQLVTLDEEEQREEETELLKSLDDEEAEDETNDLLPPLNELPAAGMYDYTTRLTNDDDDEDRDRSSVYNLIASPARSLSSLAASDSESEPDETELKLDGFEPPFTSTQMDGKDKALGWMGYNSQFDVNGKVDMVSKFMEKDVDVDFGGWLRDMSVEPVGESP